MIISDNKNQYAIGNKGSFSGEIKGTGTFDEETSQHESMEYGNIKADDEDFAREKHLSSLKRESDWPRHMAWLKENNDDTIITLRYC